ncbi:hypothetical protein [Inhella sp.]|uniref:hypothetical protein n=1 Tax=Inhella sp. TaxID=1921806 RepID=UPI0035B1CF20
MHSKPVASVRLAPRFWLGMVLPAPLLVPAFIGLAIDVGAYAALPLLFLAAVALPAAVLLNGWVLFLRWPPQWLALGSLLAPAVLLWGAADAVRAQRGDEAGGLAQWLFDTLKWAGNRPTESAALWLLLLAGSLGAAKLYHLQRASA